jgi:putative oxidoreductase
MNSDRLSTVWAPGALGVLSILRIFTGLALLQHGTGKILGFPVAPMFANGLLFTIGLFTRPVAFILSGFTAAAYFMAHAGKGFYPLLNGGELAALYSFVFLYFTFAGAGPWSADALIRRK